MYGDTKLSAADQKTIADRFLLTPGLCEFPGGVILVSCGDAMGGSQAEVRLTLTAPGLDEHIVTLNSLREGLAAWLRVTLTREGLGILKGLNVPEDLLRALSALVNTNWAYGVTIEPHFSTEEPEIVVSIDDCQIPRDAVAPAHPGGGQPLPHPDRQVRLPTRHYAFGCAAVCAAGLRGGRPVPPVHAARAAPVARVRPAEDGHCPQARR